MQEITKENCKYFLERFEYANNALIDQINIDFENKHVELRLDVYDTSKTKNNWTIVLIKITNNIEFLLKERAGKTGVQLDDHLEIVWLEEKLFLILDPLHAQDFNKTKWDIDQIKKSRWYIGGDSIYWDIIE